MSLGSILDDLDDLNVDARSGWHFDPLSPVYSPVPSVCGAAYFEDESNGPFIGRADPLLSSSASNLTTLVVEAEKASDQRSPNSSAPPPPSLAQLKREDHYSLYTSSLRAPFQSPETAAAAAAAAAAAVKQEMVSRSPFSFQIADPKQTTAHLNRTIGGTDRNVPVASARPKFPFGFVPTRDVRGGVHTSESPSPPLWAKKRSARIRSLRATSMSSICSSAPENECTSRDNSDLDDDDDDFDATRCYDDTLDHGQPPPRKRGRRKDGVDDFSPNPARLRTINRKLDKLTETMAHMIPVTDVPAHAKNKSRKERNKLASRACRLKKKASFEANKVKLSGLEDEQDQLAHALSTLKQEIENRKENPFPLVSKFSMTSLWNEIAKPALEFRVAGRMSEYVSEVLEQAKDTGGIDSVLEESD